MAPELDPDEIRQRMRALRNSLDFDVERITSSVRAKTDWRYIVRSHPWLTLAAATAVGYLVVPRRVEKRVPDADTLTQLAKEGKLVFAPQGISRPQRDSWMSKLFAVALAVGSRAAVTYATNMLSQTFEKTSGQDSEQLPAYASSQPK